MFFNAAPVVSLTFTVSFYGSFFHAVIYLAEQTIGSINIEIKPFFIDLAREKLVTFYFW